MSQVTDFDVPGSPLTMSALATALEAVFAALGSINRGAAAPSNPFEGMLWWDSAAVVEILKRYTVTAGWATILTVNRSTGVVAFSSSTNVVTLTDTQTLTNKTLTSPIINSGGDLQPHIVTVPIGAWNMDTNANKIVNSPSLAPANVISATAVIFNDAGTSKYPIAYAGTASTVVLEGPAASIYVDESGGFARAQLHRRTGHDFDGVLFDSVLVNRGYVFFLVAASFATEYGSGL